jgi:hypothetical protein
MIQETKQLINFEHFLMHEVGLREELSTIDLKVLLNTLKQLKND